MIRKIYQKIRTWGDSDEEPTFVGSLLDRSVWYSHGGGGEESERELRRVQEEADKLSQVRNDH